MFRQLTGDTKELLVKCYYEEEAKEIEEKVVVLEAHFIQINQISPSGFLGFAVRTRKDKMNIYFKIKSLDRDMFLIRRIKN